ncbi:MAG: MATE family efflux transporter [Bacteroidales bacterium]
MQYIKIVNLANQKINLLPELISSYKSEYRRNIELAAPILLAQAGQVLVQYADTIMVGRIGVDALAAASFGGSIAMLCLLICMGVSMGLTPIVGKLYSGGNHRDSSHFFQNSIVVNLLLAVILSILFYGISFLFSDMGQTPEVVEYSLPYYRMLIYSVVPYMLFLTFKQFTEGVGNTKISMIITIAANLINILFNYLLIYGKGGFPELGIEGAGIATLLSRIAMPLFFVFYYLRNHTYKRYLCFFRKSAFSRKRVMDLCRMGFPIGLQFTMEHSAFMFNTIMMGWFGAAALAAHQITLQTTLFGFMIATGISNATMIRVSHEYGKRNYLGAKRAASASFHIITLFMSFMAIVYYFLREPVAGIFTSDPQVIEIASSLLIIGAVYQISDGLQLVSVGALRGIGDVKVPMYYSFFCYMIASLATAYLFGFKLGFGENGLWYGFVAGLSLACVLYLTRWTNCIQKKIENA